MLATNQRLVVSQACQVKKHLDDMVEKEKKEASEEGHEAPASGFCNRNPTGGRFSSFYLPLQKFVRNFVEVMMKKNPCSLASATSVGHWASGVGVGSFWLKGVANPGDVDGSCYEKIPM